MSDPIFIIGSPRSGTSIFTWCLGQHPNIYPLEETVWFGKCAHGLEAAFRLGSSRGERSQLSAMGITRDRFFRAFGEAIDGLIREHQTRAATRVAPGVAFARVRSPEDPKGRWIDGTPENSFHVPRLRRLWPEARFIHLVRDGDAVVRSLRRFSRAGGRDHDADEAYEKWIRHVRACLEAETEAPGRVLRLYHANLVSNPADTIRAALDFVGEPFDEACLLPLGTKINSSGVPETDSPETAPIHPETLAEARALGRRLFADGNALESREASR
ncbi:MAG: sulfotransferase [Gemmatimonadota bacterium]|nr:sulfotransferase [Gemmatimonadota bacterium]